MSSRIPIDLTPNETAIVTALGDGQKLSFNALKKAADLNHAAMIHCLQYLLEIQVVDQRLESPESGVVIYFLIEKRDR